MTTSAKQIVSRLLEYGVSPDAPAPEDDSGEPWRKGGFDPKKMKFTGKRSKQGVKASKKPDRFKWKPPAHESLLRKLIGVHES